MSTITDLKNNPIFQLSLASKELFHSNFLYWLSQDPDLKQVFEGLVKYFTGDEQVFKNVQSYVVLREYNNLDLCVCKVKDEVEDSWSDEEKAGEIIFVLENKFKSIATEQQLKGYVDKVFKLNLPYYKKASGKTKKKDKIEFINESKERPYTLLTLAENFAEKKAIENINNIEFHWDFDGKPVNATSSFNQTGHNWNIINYRDFAYKLKEHLDKVSDSLSKGIIEKYAEFILTFATVINDDSNKDILSNDWKFIFGDNDFSQIRCSDIWQKITMHKVAQKYKKAFEDEMYNVFFQNDNKVIFEDEGKNNNIYITVAFFRGHAVLAVKIPLEKGVFFNVMKQSEDKINLCLEVTKKVVKNKKNNKDNWNKAVRNLVSKKNLKKIMKVGNNTTFNSYENKDGSACYYVTVKDETTTKGSPTTIGDTLEYIKKKIAALKMRKR